MSRDFVRMYVREILVEVTRLPFKMLLPGDLLHLSDAFNQAGYQLYVVGGSVRDALLGKEPKDYDVATDAVPDVVIELLLQFPDHKVIEVGKSFGVVKVITPEGNEYEIATFRSDIGKGRRPDAVEFTSIDKDVMRRDLTINALFYDIERGEVVDYVGGIDDIKKGVVKAVGNARERFDEDRLRILRALRFAARMGNDLDPETAQAIEDDNSLHGVSPERIRDEFLKGIMSSKTVRSFLAMITRFDLWPQVFPGLHVADDPDAYGPGVESRNIPVILAALLDANAPDQVQRRLNALKYTSPEAAATSFLLRFSDLSFDNAYRLRKFANATKVDDETLIDYVHISGVPNRKLLMTFLEYQPSVSGNDLMAQGFSGSDLGRELERRETVRFRQLYDNG
jgi:tRNA nucleotidyltransferase/poly(A) polymerase